MKFEYEGGSEDRECVAFIDSDGDLVILDSDGDSVCIGENCVHPDYDLSDSVSIIHKFYPGDKITITF